MIKYDKNIHKVKRTVQNEKNPRQVASKSWAASVSQACVAARAVLGAAFMYSARKVSCAERPRHGGHRMEFAKEGDMTQKTWI
jgi:hypothetical protein